MRQLESWAVYCTNFTAQPLPVCGRGNQQHDLCSHFFERRLIAKCLKLFACSRQVIWKFNYYWINQHFSTLNHFNSISYVFNFISICNFLIKIFIKDFSFCRSSTQIPGYFIWVLEDAISGLAIGAKFCCQRHPQNPRCSVLLSCIHQASQRNEVCHSTAGQKLATKIVMNDFALPPPPPPPRDPRQLLT